MCPFLTANIFQRDGLFSDCFSVRTVNDHQAEANPHTPPGRDADLSFRTVLTVWIRLNTICHRISVYYLILVVCPKKTEPISFLQYHWFLLINFNDFFHRYNQKWSGHIFGIKIFQLTSTALSHYLRKIFCSKYQSFTICQQKVHSIWTVRSDTWATLINEHTDIINTSPPSQII